MLNIKRTDSFGFPILQLEGRLDLVTFPSFLREMSAVPAGRTVGVDLTQLDELDTAGATVLDATSDWLTRQGGRLKILGCSPTARRWLHQEVA